MKFGGVFYFLFFFYWKKNSASMIFALTFIREREKRKELNNRRGNIRTRLLYYGFYYGTEERCVRFGVYLRNRGSLHKYLAR